MRRLLTGIIFIVGLSPLALPAQLRLFIDSVPTFTPPEDTLYLAGSFNNWNPADARFRLSPTGRGSYRYEFLTPMPDFTYKVTRGSWERVEGGDYAGPIDNRTYRYNGAASDTLRIVVRGWEDLLTHLPSLDTLHLKVGAIPESTPADASLYATGSFNGWTPRDENYKMRPGGDGTYTVSIPLRSLQTEFKITRGSWASIESRANGLALPNRRYAYAPNAPRQELLISVANWEDLGSPVGWYDLLMMLSASQFVLLLLVLVSLRAKNRRANALLGAILLLLAMTIFARVGAFNRDVFQAFPKLILLPDLLYFGLPPLLYAFLRVWARADFRLNPLVHFLPLAAGLLAYLPYLGESDAAFTTRILGDDLRRFFDLASLSGLALALGYGYASWRLLRGPAEALAGNVAKRRFLIALFAALGLPVTLWILACAVALVNALGPAEWGWYQDRLIDATWLLLSLVAYVVTYYLVRHPALFREPNRQDFDLPTEPAPLAPSREAEAPAAPLDSSAHIPLLPEPKPVELVGGEPSLGQRLDELMSDAAPYLNPGLSLPELAALLGVSPHQLSKTINDDFNKNFFDYVNSYRVAAFQERIRRGDHATLTILSVALEVGFNSKTAFNRAFKKITGLTPRQFLRNLGAAD